MVSVPDVTRVDGALMQLGLAAVPLLPVPPQAASMDVASSTDAVRIAFMEVTSLCQCSGPLAANMLVALGATEHPSREHPFDDPVGTHGADVDNDVGDRP